LPAKHNFRRADSPGIDLQEVPEISEAKAVDLLRDLKEGVTAPAPLTVYTAKGLFRYTYVVVHHDFGLGFVAFRSVFPFQTGAGKFDTKGNEKTN
jgi:hypothetical protein